MKIAVQNLGTIKEGSISLDKSLTVLVGPNNSGKSYISYLIYGFLKDGDKFKDFSFNLKDSDLKRNKNDKYVLDLDSKFLKNADNIADYLIKYYNSKVVQYFSSSRIQAKIDLPYLKDNLVELFSEGIVKLNEAEEIDESSLIYKVFESLLKDKEVTVNLFKLALNYHLKGFTKKILSPEIHFFPTERLALSMLSNDEVERKSKQQDELSKLLLYNNTDNKYLKKFLTEKDRFKPSYPQAINDYIYFINDLGDIVKQEGDYANFADEIQEMLMQGKISVSSYGDINYTPKGQDEPIEIHISSSLVKSLSGLILYFRHVAQEGDTIIIDEPEVNLHPNNQRIIARVVAKAINKGFKVILSTHSDYIIKELNNLVMLNKANEKPEIKKVLLEDLAKDGYDENSYLKKEDLGVYFFNNHTIQELEVDDMGFDVATIDTEMDKMTYSSEQIYYSLFGQEQEAE